jgi:Spy/CpxP family protein refolding chaperone
MNTDRRRVRVRRLARGIALGALIAAPVLAVDAQGGPPRVAPTTGVAPTGGQPPGNRRDGRAIEAELQRRIMGIMKERLSLNDDQLDKLAEVTRRFERERFSQRGAEYRLRMSLRRELMKGDSASQERVAELIAQMPDVERRGIDLMEREQRELSQFLTPVQRARFLALQDEIRRNMEQIRERRDSTGSNSRGGRPSGPPRDGDGRGRP